MGASADLAQAPGQHLPVLLREVVTWLAPRAGERYLDLTVGGGGHAAALLEATAPTGQLLGFDRDIQAVAQTMKRLAPFGARAQVVHSSYRHLEVIARERGFWPVAGVLFDLGFSSLQVDDPERGFAFRLEGPLDMRYDPQSDAPTAAELLNQLSEIELRELLWRYGEEPRSRRIAQAIVAARPIYTTTQLADSIAQAVGRPRHGRLHPATRTFQALRLAVNRELEALEATLPQAVAALQPGGRLAVITFHSLEDRMVKQFMRQAAQGCNCPPESPVCTCGQQPTLRILTRKPVTPSSEELAANPRSRSAKLRVAERLASAQEDEER